MKKILLTFIAAIGLGATANAQLPDGSVFPDFTVTDINGVSHNLYSVLNSGKTVFIDVSATWCAPCWAYHISGELDSVWAKHGPTGAPGVDLTTTNDVEVYFFQGEPTSGMAQLTNNTIGSGAVTTGGTHATFTQGNWVAGTHYYIVDDSTAQGPRNTLWNINYFPTVYMICRDHIVHELTQPTEAEAYAAAQAGCPTYAPSATVDAKATAYAGSTAFICSATPSVSFQNYSTTNTITSATITVKDGTGATVATAPWTGSLAPYAVANVTIPSFTATTFGGYKYTVTVAGDTYPANNASADSVFKVYTAGNAGTTPFTQDFETSVSYKENFSSTDGYIYVGAFTGQIGAAGTASDALFFRNFYSADGNTQTYLLGNFNTTSLPHYALRFDVAAAQYAATTNDKLEVRVSTDCGATWTTPWSQSGATLATAPISTSEFHPTAAGQWKHVSVDLSGNSNANTMIQLRGTSNYGNNVFIDNINLASTAAVANINEVSEVTMFPNPAMDATNINFTLNAATNVNVSVYDAMGRVVNTSVSNLNAGAQSVSLSTTGLAAGVYNVKITIGDNVITKQLSVIK